MRRISTNFWTVLLRFYATAGTSRNTHASSSTEKTTHRKFTRRKNADTFGTLSSFEEKLIPFKVLNRPKRMDDAFGDGGLYDEEFEGNKEEEEIGWTSNFLQMKRKETKELPVITQPLAFEREKRRKAKKRKEFEEEYEKLYGVDRNTAKVIIECARKEFNHYEGMRYPPGNINLVSKYWAKCKYKNDWFTIHAIMRKNPSFNSDEAFSWDENVSLLNSTIIENSRRLGFRTPTVVQHRTFRFFNSDTHLLIAAETGSGKTVAYAAPLLSTLMQTTDRQAKAIVMVPTHALRIQTYQMISKLAEGTTVKIIGETEKWKNENFNTNMAWNILVTTPSLSPEFLNSINIDFIVLDEADMLLDDSFLEDIVRLLKFLKIRYPVTDKYNSDGARLILSTATYPDKLQQIFESIVTSERLRCVTTENLHRLMPHVKQTFIRIREMDKEEKLKELLEKGISFASGQTLVFCKNSRNAYSVSASLKDSNIEHILLTGGRRIEHLFDEIHKIRVIVATDVASRGLDLPHLRHVINYDFPRQISDYVHRCGRIGRAGSLHKCLITSFVRRAWEVKHVNLIELAARRGQPLENVELNDPARLRGVQRNLI